MQAATFSPYNDKSSAKRGFGRKFKDMAQRVDEFLVQSKDQHDDMKWGFYADEAGPVVYITEAKRDGALEAALEQHEEDGNDKVGAAFAAFALGQLTAPKAPEVDAPVARPAVAAKIQKDRPESNGVKRPSAGTLCAQVWDVATSLSGFVPEGSEGSPVATKGTSGIATLSQVVKACEAAGINKYTARTQYARWRVFHGITGRIVA